jgi:hypothetical protein
MLVWLALALIGIALVGRAVSRLRCSESASRTPVPTPSGVAIAAAALIGFLAVPAVVLVAALALMNAAGVGGYVTLTAEQRLCFVASLGVAAVLGVLGGGATARLLLRAARHRTPAADDNQAQG